MAIIAEFRTPKGVLVRIDDCEFAGLTDAQMRERERLAARQIFAIAKRHAERLPEEERAAFFKKIAAPSDALPPGVYLGKSTKE